MTSTILKIFLFLQICFGKVGAFINGIFSLGKGQRKSTEVFASGAFSDQRRICVVGGGFGGLYTALSLSKEVDDKTSIVLVDPKERFVFLPLLYELAVGSASEIEVAPKYSDLLLGSKVSFKQGYVTDVDFQKQTCTVRLADDTVNSLDYDQLVFGVGSQPRLGLIPGASEHALPFYGLSDANELSTFIKAAKLKKEVSNIVIIGGGYSGIELATNLANTLGNKKCKVSIVQRDSRILPVATAYVRKVATEALSKYNVEVHYNHSVKEVTSQAVIVEDLQSSTTHSLPADITLFSAGVEPLPFVQSLSLTKDTYQRIVVKKTLQSVDYDNVFAIGDCTSLQDTLLPATAQVALQQSYTLTRNLQLAWRNKICHEKYPMKAAKQGKGKKDQPLEEFSYFSLGEMMSLGDFHGTISGFNGLINLTGPLAAMGRRAVYAFRMPTLWQSFQAFTSAGHTTTNKIMQDALNTWSLAEPAAVATKSEKDKKDC